MKIKWYGTATIVLEQNGTQLLFDPFLPRSNKVFMPSKNELSAIENVFVTHGHLDHIVDIPAIVRDGNGKALVYCTEKPREVLMSKGLQEKHIKKIAPGNNLSLGPFKLRVLKGKHIVFDMGLVLKTLFNPRLLFYWSNFRYMLKENKDCVEAGETVVYDISVANNHILLMGSLNLDDETDYPTGADLLIMPFQGRSDINKYAMQFIDRLKPKKVLLDHFDDTFPPISSAVKTSHFLSLMQQKYPGLQVIVPQSSAEWIGL